MAAHDYNIANASGLSFRADLNTVLQAILTNNSSATTPITTQPFMWWYDTTASLLKMRNSVNTGWDIVVPITASLASKLATARTINGVYFDGSANINIEDRKGSNIASVATTVIGTSGIGDYIHITGTTGITSFGTASVVGVRRTLIFDGALTITHNASTLICVGSANIVTVANTVIEVVAETTTSWRVISITHPALGISELSYLDGVTSAIQGQLDAKQATLVSGTNIKTVGGQSIIGGGGDISIPTDTISSIFANSQIFTASGTFTVPAGVTQLMVFIASGGGGGGGGKAINGGVSASGGGGGASDFVTPALISVTGGQSLSVTVGNGGAGGAGLAYSQAYTIGNGGNGGASSIGSMTVMGSAGGNGANAAATGGNGGANTLGIVAGVNATGTSAGYPAQGGLGVSRATGGISGTGSAGGIGGTSSVNNGANGVAGVNGLGGAGGAGGAGKVVVYW